MLPSVSSQTLIIPEQKERHHRSQREKTEPETIIRNAIAKGVQNRCRQGERVKLYVFVLFIFACSYSGTDNPKNISINIRFPWALKRYMPHVDRRLEPERCPLLVAWRTERL